MKPVKALSHPELAAELSHLARIVSASGMSALDARGRAAAVMREAAVRLKLTARMLGEDEHIERQDEREVG